MSIRSDSLPRNPTPRTVDNAGRGTHNGSTPANVTTAYTYDVGNRLRRVCANQSYNQQSEQCGQVRLFEYDNRGFLTSETLPEVGAFGKGTISYEGRYDARGHAHWKHDGTHALAFDFDRAERLLRVSEADADKLPTALKLKEYTYATANAGTDLANGKLRTAWATHIAPEGSTDPALNAVIQETYTYAGVGGAVSAKTTAVTVTGSTVANPVQTFSQAFTWTDLGLLASQSYPACTGAACAETPGRTVYNTYAAGFLTAVEPYYATAITYHPSGMTDSLTHAKRVVTVGAGVVDRQSIASTEMARPAQIWTVGATLSGTGADADWDTGVYAYDGAGNITAMGVQGFDYDKVSRLIAGTVTGFGVESYTYDPYGNLTQVVTTEVGHEPVTSPLTTDTETNRLDHPTTGASYDAAGNLTSLGLTPNVTTYNYDRFNQLVSVLGPGINRSQATTADGERLFVREGTTTYLFTLRDLSGNVVREFEYTAAGGWRWKRDNVYRGGLLLASEARNEGIKHYHLDHLGSPRLVTNRTGEKYTLFATSPFGKDPTATQSGERMRFTVHERDLGQLTDVLDDIDYMHARSYTPRLGRFLSIDPVRGSPKRPQSLNLLAYVRGNPVGSLDPSGELVYIVAYTTGNPRADEELRRAAETRAQEIMKANKAFWDDRYDKVLVVGVSSKAEFADALKQAKALEAQFGKVASLDMYSHAGPLDGPTFPTGGRHFSKSELSEMAVNWAPGATATFHGCNTGNRFSAAFASAQGVTTYGNPRYAYFSGSPSERTPIAPRGPVYLPSVPGKHNPGLFFTDWVRWALGNTWADPMTRSER